MGEEEMLRLQWVHEQRLMGGIEFEFRIGPGQGGDAGGVHCEIQLSFRGESSRMVVNLLY
jgi:hypothetical protein